MPAGVARMKSGGVGRLLSWNRARQPMESVFVEILGKIQATEQSVQGHRLSRGNLGASDSIPDGAGYCFATNRGRADSERTRRMNAISCPHRLEGGCEFFQHVLGRRSIILLVYLYPDS